MKRTGSIKGIVRDADGRPIEDVNIVILSGPVHRDIAAISGPDGSFGFGRLELGDYVLQAYGSDSESQVISVPVVAGKIAFVEIWLVSEPKDCPNHRNGEHPNQDSDIVPEI